MQIIEHDAAIGGAGSARDREHLIERRHARKMRRQHFKQDIGAALGGLTAQGRKLRCQLVNIGAIIPEIGNLDMPSA